MLNSSPSCYETTSLARTLSGTSDRSVHAATLPRQRLNSPTGLRRLFAPRRAPPVVPRVASNLEQSPQASE